MAKKVEAWEASDGQMFSTRKKADYHDAETQLRIRLMSLVSINGEVNGVILDRLVGNHLSVKRVIDEYLEALSRAT